MIGGMKAWKPTTCSMVESVMNLYGECGGGGVVRRKSRSGGCVGEEVKVVSWGCEQDDVWEGGDDDPFSSRCP